MKIFITVLFWILVVNTVVFSQTKSLFFSRPQSCKQAIELARKDAAQGILVMLSYGYRQMETNEERDFEKFRRSYLIWKYGIEPVELGCVFNECQKCYGNEMEILMQKKFSASSLSMMSREVWEVFVEHRKFKTSDEKWKESYVNVNYAHTFPETRAQFKEGRDALVNKLRKCIFHLKGDTAVDIISTYLIVDRRGKISESEVRSAFSEPQFAKQIDKAIRKAGKWLPAKFYGVNVKSQLILDFTLLHGELKLVDYP